MKTDHTLKGKERKARLYSSDIMISSSFSEPNSIKNVLISGRLAKLEPLIEPLINKINRIATPRVMRSYAQITKESAQGAAFIANGLLGGEFKDIIDNLKIMEASGNILDNIYLPISDFKK